MKRAASFIAVAALLVTSCGLKVPTTIVAGSDIDNGPVTNPDDPAAVATLDPTLGDPTADVGGDTPVGTDAVDPSVAAGAAESIFNLETEGITRDRITVCAHVPITGAAPIPHHENRFGQFYFDKVNAEDGGVYGRKVTFRAINDRYYPAEARNAMEQCKRQGSFIYFGAAGTDQIVSVAHWAQQNKVPYFHGPTSIADMKELTYNVHVGPTYEYQHRLLARYLVKRFGKDQIFGSVRVNSRFFEAGVAAFADELEKLGAQHVAEIRVEKTERQFQNVFFELDRKNVTIVNNFTTPSIWIPMLTQKPTGYNPWFTAVSPVAGFNIVAAALPSGIRSVVFHHFQPACDCQTYTDKVPPPRSLPWYDDIQEFLRVFRAYSPEQRPDPDDFDYSSYLAAKAIHRILLKLGPDPTRTKLWDLVFSYKETPKVAFPGCPGDFTRGDERIGAWRVNVMELTSRKTWRQVETCIDKV